MSDVVQHCFGTPGSGGPATALARLRAHSRHDYPVVLQTRPAGGISVSLLWSMTSQFRALRPRLVHVRGLGNEGFHAAVAARLAGVPNVLVSVHGTHRDLQSTRGGLRRKIVTYVLEPLTLRLATAVVTVCRFAATRDFMQSVRTKTLDPVHNGVPLPALPDPRGAEIRRALGISPDRHVAVIVSRQTMDKGYPDLAGAVKMLDTQGVKFDLIVVGGGDHDGAIKSLFNGLEEIKAHFVGHQSDVGPYLAAADIFVFPSWQENLPNALLEAMSFGLPAITTDVGGNSEVLEHGGGILLPPHDPESLANALRDLLTDGDRRSVLGAEARRNIELHFSIERMVEAWEDTYRKILNP